MGNPDQVPFRRESLALKPVHLQLAEKCRERILSGEFKLDQKFPSERELALDYEVSRATANKAISVLIAEELLEFRKGKGTFVRRKGRLFATLDGMESFHAHITRKHMKPSTTVLGFERLRGRNLPEKVRKGLGLEIKGHGIYVERLRLANGVPVILEYRWLRESMLPRLEREDLTASFYSMLQRNYDLTMSGERHSISAVVLTDAMAKTLDAPPLTPALLAEGQGFVKELQNQPLWYQQVFYRGDLYALQNDTYGHGACLNLTMKDPVAASGHRTSTR